MTRVPDLENLYFRTSRFVMGRPAVDISSHATLPERDFDDSTATKKGTFMISACVRVIIRFNHNVYNSSI